MGEPLSDHWLPLPLLDVSSTLPPVQNVVGPPGVIVGVAGSGLTVTTVAAEVALQLLPSVTVTGSEEGRVGQEGRSRGSPNHLKKSFHWVPLPLLDGSSTLPPAQN